MTAATVAAMVFGGFRAGVGGALSGLVVASFASNLIRFLSGIHRTLWIRAVRRARLGVSPAIESKLAQLYEARVREGTALTKAEDAAIEELLDACEAEFLTACVLAEHEATRPLLRKVYLELVASGGGVRIQEYFLPAAALGTAETLDFLLASQELSGTAKVELLEGFFRGKKVLFPMGGPSDSDLLSPGPSLGGAPPAITQRMSEIAQRLAATHPKGLLKEPTIKVQLEHNDLDRAQEDLVRSVKEGLAIPAIDPGSRRGESRPLSHAVALGQLIDLAHDHPPTARVIQRYDATRERLAKIYEELHDHGGNRWEGDGYVAAAALLHPETLAFLLAENSVTNPYERTRQVARFLQGFPLTPRLGRDPKRSGPRQVGTGPGLLSLVRVNRLLASGQAEEVIATLESSIGSSGADSADDALYYLGTAYLQVGRFDAAEAALARAVESARYQMHMADASVGFARRLLRAGGVNRFSLLRDLYGLGTARFALADYSGAQDAFGEALEQARLLHLTRHLSAQLRPPLNQFIVNLFDRLGEVHQARGQSLKAQVMYGCSFRRRIAFYGPRHAETGKSVYKLGVVARELGQYARGKVLLDEAEAVFRATGLTKDPDFMRIIFAQARADLDAGDYVAADRRYRALAENDVVSYAQDNLLMVDALASSATAYAAVDAPEHALQRLESALEVLDRNGSEILRGSSERRGAAYLATCRDYVDIYATLCAALVARHHEHASEAVEGLFSLALRYKGIGAEIAMAQRRVARATTEPRLAECLRELASLRAEAATLELRRSRTGEAPTSLRLLQLARQREQFEQELARGVPETAPTEQTAGNAVATVAAALPAGHTLIDYLRYEEHDFKALVARGEPRWKPARYLAFVLDAGEPASLSLIDLGNAMAIDEQVAAFRSELSSDIEDLQTGSGSEADSWFIEHPSTKEIGQRLRAAVLDPLSLDGRAALLIAADGNLATLPFGALPDAVGKPLLLEHRIAYLGVARDLLRLSATRDTRDAGSISEAPHVSRNPAVVAADPDFWLGCSSAPTEESEGDADNRFFEQLDGTRKEAEVIADMLGVRPVLGDSFTKSLLKACASPAILHVATHGFYLPAEPGGAEARRGWSRPNGDGKARRLSDFMPGLENPMLRSGLVTGGANAWLRGDQLPRDVGDGLITAEEVADMDLRHTEMTVLSACETGLGDISAGEGVFGLRRAFALAGSRALVTSLWRVPDQETRELMEDFYANLLRGMGRADALREAQLVLRKSHPNPRDWAAFISQGELGPIESLVGRRRLHERTTEIERALTSAIDAEVLNRARDITAELADDGDFAGAIRLQRRVHDALTGARGNSDPATVDATGWLAALLRFAGDLAEARPVSEAHVAASERLHGAEHEATNEAREQLALILGELGEWGRARTLREDAVRFFRQRRGDDDVDTLRAEANLAEAIKETGDVGTCYQMQCRVLERLKRALGEEDPLCLAVLSNISVCALRLGNVHEARKLQERCLSGRRKALGERDAETIKSMSILATIRAELGDREGAFDLEEKVLLWRRLVLGEDHLDTLMATHNMAVSLAALGDRAQALDLERKVAEQAQRAFGDAHDLTLTARGGLATMLEEGDASSEEVCGLRREIHEHTRAAHGDDDARTLTAAADLAESLKATGDLLGATELLQMTLERRRRAKEPDVRAIAGLMSRVANLWHSRGKDDRAVELSREAVALCHSAFGGDDATTLALKHNLAAVLQNANVVAEARHTAQEVFDARQRLLGENHPDTLATMSILAATLDASGEREMAAAMLYRLVPLALRSLGERSSTTIAALHMIGRNLLERKLYPEAREMLEESSAIYSRVRGDEHKATLREKRHFAIALLGCGEGSAARDVLEAIVRVRARTLGPDHPDTLEIEEILDHIRPDPDS